MPPARLALGGRPDTHGADRLGERDAHRVDDRQARGCVSELDELRTQVAAATLTERNRYVDAAGIERCSAQRLRPTSSFSVSPTSTACCRSPGRPSRRRSASTVGGRGHLTAFAAGRAEAISADTVVAHADGPQVTCRHCREARHSGRRTRRRHRLPPTCSPTKVPHSPAVLTWSNEPPHLATRRSPRRSLSSSPPPRLQGRVRGRSPLTGPEATAAITTAGGARAKASWKLHPPILKCSA